jgi:hypothetical protein
MKHILAILFALFATSAFAVGIGNDNPPSGGGDVTNVSTNINTVSPRISNDIRNNAAAWQVQKQQQQQQQSATSNSGGNTFTVNEAPVPTVTTTNINQNDYTVRNVPNVFSGNVYPTAPCMGSSQVGGAGVGFGFSIGSSWTDDECGIRETARSFSGLGLKEDAVKVLCTSKYAAAAPACAGPAKAE